MTEQRKRASRSDCKTAWETFPGKKKSERSVVKWMRESGFAIAVSTFRNWRKRGWTNGKRSAGGNSNKVNAKTASEMISKNIEKHEHSIGRLAEIMLEEAAMKAEREMLLSSDISDDELARTAVRESLVTQIIIARQFSRRASVLVEVAPSVAAKVLEVLKSCQESESRPQLEAPPSAPANGDGARVIDGKVIEKSASQLAIESFRLRRVAA